MSHFRFGSLRFVGFLAFIGWALGALSSEAQATVANLASLKKAYPAAKAISCKVCHLGAVGKKGDLNAYGEAQVKLKAAVGAKKLTEADLKAIEKEDSDGDGASNLAEIVAGTGPGEK